MKKVLPIVLLVVIGGAAFVGYSGYRTVKNVILSGCRNGCTSEDHGGPMVQGSGHLATETRSVASFTAVRSESSADLMIERTGAVSLSVTADDNLLPFFLSEVRDGTLYLSVAKGKSFQGKTPVYRMTVADLREIHLQGSGDIKADKLDGAALVVNLAGSGDVRLAGRADDLTLSIKGSGDINAAALTSKTAKVVMSGSGDVIVNASDSLDVHLSGSGDLRYLGSPKLTKDVTGSGSVERK